MIMMNGCAFSSCRTVSLFRTLSIKSTPTILCRCSLNWSYRRNVTYSRSRPWTGVAAAAPDPDQLKKMQETMDEAMKNPQLKERMNQMQEALKNPQVRQQVEQTMKYMQNEETQKKIQEIREDPELKEKFQEIREGGFGAMMKAMNDLEFLEKVGRKVGPLQMNKPTSSTSPPPAQEEAPPLAPAPVQAEEPQLPEINTILDAAKHGDLEAVEDFLAIGKDPNLVDEFNRTPLHFAASIQHMEIIEALLSAGANLELADSKNNTPLHYAAGYGRVKAAQRLLEAGANGSAKNENGKSPADVARLSDQNPILQEANLIAKLEEAASNC